MTQYLLSVHMVDGEDTPSPEEIAVIYNDVDTFNDEVKARGIWASPVACTPPTPQPW